MSERRQLFESIARYWPLDSEQRAYAGQSFAALSDPEAEALHGRLKAAWEKSVTCVSHLAREKGGWHDYEWLGLEAPVAQASATEPLAQTSPLRAIPIGFEALQLSAQLFKQIFDRAADSWSASERIAARTPAPDSAVLELANRVTLIGMRFWATRMKAYAAQADMIAKCETPDQLVEVQIKFIEETQRQYAEEAETLRAALIESTGAVTRSIDEGKAKS